MAGPLHAETIPDLKRVWIASGRARGAWQISTHNRVDFETNHLDNHSPLIALETSESENLLFSLTALEDTTDPWVPAELKMYDVSTPAQPSLLVTHSFSAHSGEDPIDMALWHDGSDSYIVVGLRTLKTVQIFEYASAPNPSISLVGSVSFPQDGWAHSCPHGGADHFFFAIDSVVAQRINGRRIAILRAAVSAEQPKPPAQGLVAVDWTDAANPVFLSTYYDPVSCESMAGGPKDEDFSVNGVVLVQNGYHDTEEEWVAHLTCGKELGLQTLGVTDLPSAGFGTPSQIFVPGEDLFGVSVEPGVAPGDSYDLYVVGANHEYVYRSDSGIVDSKPVENGYRGIPRDTQVVFQGSDVYHWYHVRPGGVSYPLKIQQVTGGQLGTLEGQGLTGPNDGTAMLPNEDLVLALTFSGVQLYDAGQSEAVPIHGAGGYVPATHATGGTFTTEELDIGRVSATESLVVVTNGIDGFGMYGIVDGSQTLTYLGEHVGSWPPTWQPEQNIYARDVVFAGDETTPDHYVYMDVGNKTLGEISIGRFHLETGDWQYPRVPLADSYPFPVKPSVQDIEVKDGYAFVACQGGFFVIQILTSTTGSWGVLKQVVRTNDPNAPTVCGTVYDAVEGITLHDDRLFTSLGGYSGEPFAIAMWDFDPATGLVATPALTCLQDTGAVDDFPGITLDGGGETSAVRIAGDKVRVYSSVYRPGGAIELEYDLLTDELTWVGYWQDPEYRGPVDGAEVFVVGNPTPYPSPADLRLVLTKTTEGFAVVQPVP